MENFYDRLIDLKKYYKLSNNTLGSIVGMTGGTFSKAVTRMNLSGIDVEKITDYLNTLDIIVKSGQKSTEQDTAPLIDLSRSVDKKQPAAPDVSLMVEYVINNAALLRKTIPKFDVFCKLLEVDAQNAILKEEVIRLRSSSIKS